MIAAGLSQSELARRVGMSQQAVHKLIRGTSRSTANLHRFARELGTTTAYLAGETDDPDEGAPPPEPPATIQHLMMPVAFPSQPALEAMLTPVRRARMKALAPVGAPATSTATAVGSGASPVQRAPA